MNIYTSQNNSAARLSAGMGLSRAGRHSRSGAAPELVYRISRPLTRPVRQPSPQIIHNTVHQTVIHLHQTARQRVFNRFTAAGNGTAALIVRQTPARPAPENAIDPSRPTLIASRLLRVLSADGAQKVLRPFFYRIFQSFLEQEREVWHSRPPQLPPAAAALSGSEFQSLVRSVTEAMNHQNRLNALRRGGAV